MKPIERNPRFANPLSQSSSPYLRQHANNPVYWYPWGKEALERAFFENKPIFLSIGYSTCYWCHVMEREVFENFSLASQMNKHFINIKVDREEHPELDEIYMVARQLITQEGGWPNNVFLTPDLKPFYAGGTYAPGEAYGKPGFGNLLEWINYSWTTQEQTVRQTANEITALMQNFLNPAPKIGKGAEISALADGLFAQLKQYHDARAGGFFQAPKFPHENYLSFLLSYHRYSGSTDALDIAAFSLSKMVAGGMYDQVGCGFHRYAVDKEWYVPHFEKMLYTQALLARLYTEAFTLTENDFYKDIARGILEFVSGPLTDGNGAFYSAIDAESDGIEGVYYAWTAGDLQKLLTEQEVAFFTNYYALADIPTFPGHKHPEGGVIIARKPFDQAASDDNMPYLQLAALSSQIMNKLLAARNKRNAPMLDDKIIVSWNGLMIDAFAHAGRHLQQPRYVEIAQKAANFLLEHAINNEGKLARIITAGRARLSATLEDYAYLIKGLLSLWHANGNAAMLDSARSLCARAHELFADPAGGYFYTQDSERMLVRIKKGDDSALPNPNAVMAQNLADLYDITHEEKYRQEAQKITHYFLGALPRLSPDFSSMAQAALAFASARLTTADVPSPIPDEGDDMVAVAAELREKNQTGEYELLIALQIKEGWSINGPSPNQPNLIPTQLEIQGEGVELLQIHWPETTNKIGANKDVLPVYQGLVHLRVDLRIAKKGLIRQPVKAMLSFQPCLGTLCMAIRDFVLTL